MKKNNLFLTFLLSLFFLTGCNDDDDSVRVCIDFIATVVSDTEGAYVVELDGGEKYYTSSTLNQSAKGFELGDRLYFRYFEINYDQQPDGADGSEKYPYLITNLAYEKMDILEPVEANEEVNNLPDNQLKFFYAPYLEQTTIDRNYLNFTFIVPSNAEKDPKFNLIYEKMSQDTLFFKFKATLEHNASYNRNLCYIETFELENLPKKGVLSIRFNAQEHDLVGMQFLNDSTYVLPFVLKSNP
ncbi:MAG: hypothetical protein RR346_09895 [Bacteroidales bacterium]